VSEQFLGEIRMFGFNFPPRGWALCNGQLLSISQNTALFSLLGVQYGGNGTTTFALPDLQSRVPVHQGTGTGLSSYVVGQSGGTETVKLDVQQMPAHSHLVNTTRNPAQFSEPQNRLLAPSSQQAYRDTAETGIVMSAKMIADAGGSQPHNNIQPYLTVNFGIALVGIYPSRD
jgi:microcystin-dependent protein